MREFIKVFGKDPDYKVTNLPFYIPIHAIVKVYPVYGVRDHAAKERTFWRCHFGHDKAELVTHKIVTHTGEEYFVPIGVNILEILGIEDKKTEGIGFTIKDKPEDSPGRK